MLSVILFITFLNFRYIILHGVNFIPKQVTIRFLSCQTTKLIVNFHCLVKTFIFKTWVIRYEVTCTFSCCIVILSVIKSYPESYPCSCGNTLVRVISRYKITKFVRCDIVEIHRYFVHPCTITINNSVTHYRELFNTSVNGFPYHFDCTLTRDKF